MAKTVQQGFEQLQTNLTITTLQESTVSTRQQIIRKILEKEFVVLDSFVMGSYKRHTLITPLSTSDVDIFVVLDPRYFQDREPLLLLERVRDVLKKTYLSSAIRRDGQAATITFDDFKVDIVPGFSRPPDGYIIPDALFDRWIATNPKRHIDVWAQENRSHNGRLVPLLKMLKGWNIKHGSLLRSFHLETISLQLLRGIEISDYSLAVGYVFDMARVQVKLPTLDESGYGGNVGDYLDSQAKMSEVVSALETAHERVIATKELEDRCLIRESFQKWRLIFDDYFPAYG